MGIIRKTTSVVTLGIVPFRSRKELLRRAESAHRSAVAELEREHELREAADRRVGEAEKRRRVAELQALAAAERAAKARAKARRGRRRGPSAGEQVRVGAGKLGRRARAEARRAADAAEVEARRARKAARAKAKGVRKAAEPYAEKGIERARELGHEATDAAESTVTEVRERVRRRRRRR